MKVDSKNLDLPACSLLCIGETSEVHTLYWRDIRSAYFVLERHQKRVLCIGETSEARTLDKDCI